MFNEKFDIILKDLGITSREFADFMKCDRSYINRIRSGSRVLTKRNKAARRMANVLFEYIRQTERLDRLCLMIDAQQGMSDTLLEHELADWLFEGDSETVKHSAVYGKTAVKEKNNTFAERFKAIVKLTGLSNIRLARILNVDASLISRWRTGLAVPHYEQMRDVLCSKLYERAYMQEKIDELAHMLSEDAGEMKDRTKGVEYLKNWLFGMASKENMIVESLLLGLDSLNLDGKITAMPFEAAVTETELNDDSSVYTGNDGIRKAVLRFLGNAVRNNAKELWLYSDQDMDWMIEDKTFFFRWFSLMAEVLKRGTKICIIHNINRGAAEMTEAIRGWMPLYMTGNIRSYYCCKANGSRFSTTLFLSPGRECVYSSNVAGAKEEARYKYFTKPEDTAEYEGMYRLLMTNCRELIKIKFFEDTNRFDTSIDETEGVYIMQNTLSLATMPKSLVKKILKRFDEAAGKMFLKEWKLSVKRYKVNLENAFVIELIPMPTDENIFGENVRVDTSAGEIFYRPEEFAEHMKNVIDIIERYKNFSLVVMPDNIIAAKRVVVGKKDVIVNNMTSQKVDFIINHPLMHTAFEVYIENLINKYKLTKGTLVKTLRQYI